ncbi:hypothetical protein AAG570_010555 [Ranatra chinensis]|uniref:EndoU domain-containing protein n=1 Tax=Ranatra chinensis TaxID=642074 RepID=A0ABD0YMW8_9HEMI
MGEVHRGKVGGLHNWIYYNDQQGNINYIGYYYRIIFANNKGSLLCIKYEWMGAKKKEGSMFVGTSPEIELAIFTTCFMMVKGRCHAEMGGMRFKVVTVPNKNDTNLICTAYPINETF